MKKILLASLLIVVSNTYFAQGYRWATRLGGPLTDVGRDIAVDNAGNVVTLGTFQLSMTVTTAQGTSTLTTAGGRDIYFTKSGPNGNYLWIRKIGGTSSDDGISIATDAAGNIYATGTFQNTVDFDPGAGTFNLTSLGGTDIFVLKLDPNGQFLWVQQLGGTLSDGVTSMALDGLENILLTGTFEATSDFDPGAGSANLTALGAQDIFICKLTSAGAYLWANTIGSTTNQDQSNALAVDQNNNVYITGSFYGTVDFDPGAGNTSLTSTGVYDAFVLQVDASGNFGFVRKIAGANLSSSSFGSSIAVDGNGDIYSTGSFQQTNDFDPGAGTFNIAATGLDNYIWKLDNTGNLIWAKHFSGSGQRSAFGISIDPSDNIYIAGSFENTTDFDPGAGTANKTSAGTRDIYITKLNPSGNLTWVHALGSTGMDQGFSIATDATQNVYTTGYFFNTVDFNPGIGVNNLTTSGGNGDVFIQKLGYCEPDTITDVRTSCGPFTWTNGITYTTSNTTASRLLTNIGGCDSLVYLNLTISSPSSSTQTVTACDSYTWINGVTYNSSNSTATHTLTNVNGCDSVVTLHLTIHHSSASTDTRTSCGPFTWIDGNTYTSSNNTATHTLTNAAGCDSIITLNLTVNSPSSFTDQHTSCGPFTWIDGNTYTSSNNTATHTLTNAAGCDSIITLNLTVNSPTSFTDQHTSCGPFTWIDGNTYTSSNNTATHTLTNAAGCDSVVTLNLTVNSPTSFTDQHTSCGPFTWIDGNTYTSSNNTATHTLTNAAGCDSVVTLNLTVNSPSSFTDQHTTCGPFTWIDGNTYSTSNNTATVTLTNVAGCDSVVTLQLTVNDPIHVIQAITACDSYTWIDGNMYTSSNNTATHHLTRANGCDSLVQLDLTINTSSSSSQTVTTCGSYTWINCVTYTTSTTATHTLTNHLGCDSVITLNLTILPTSSSIQSITSCGPYTWIDGNTYTSSNNTATFTTTNVAGCDSVITLHLTVLHENSTQHVIQSCGPYTWIDGVTYTASTNTPTLVLQNTSGCDSIIHLDLTITTIDVTVTENSGILTANQANAQYQWIDCSNGGTPIPGETGQSFTVLNAGSYAVRISKGNCTEISACTPVQAQRLNENQLPEIIVFPNPTFDLLTITSDATIELIRVYNEAGQLVLTSTEDSFSTAQLAAGTYHLKIATDKGSVTRLFIKQ